MIKLHQPLDTPNEVVYDYGSVTPRFTDVWKMWRIDEKSRYLQHTPIFGLNVVKTFSHGEIGDCFADEDPCGPHDLIFPGEKRDGDAKRRGPIPTIFLPVVVELAFPDQLSDFPDLDADGGFNPSQHFNDFHGAGSLKSFDFPYHCHDHLL